MFCARMISVRAIVNARLTPLRGFARLRVPKTSATLFAAWDPVESWRWIVTPDDRLCRWCMRREGLTPEAIRKLPGGGDPWGMSTNLPLHPHCRCTSEPILKTWRELGIDMPEEYGIALGTPGTLSSEHLKPCGVWLAHPSHLFPRCLPGLAS